MPMGFSSENDWVISLERLDVTKSYTLDNIAFICCELYVIDVGIKLIGVHTGTEL